LLPPTPLLVRPKLGGLIVSGSSSICQLSGLYPERNTRLQHKNKGVKPEGLTPRPVARRPLVLKPSGAVAPKSFSRLFASAGIGLNLPASTYNLALPHLQQRLEPITRLNHFAFIGCVLCS